MYQITVNGVPHEYMTQIANSMPDETNSTISEYITQIGDHVVQMSSPEIIDFDAVPVNLVISYTIPSYESYSIQSILTELQKKYPDVTSNFSNINNYAYYTSEATGYDSSDENDTEFIFPIPDGTATHMLHSELDHLGMRCGDQWRKCGEIRR